MKTRPQITIIVPTVHAPERFPYFIRSLKQTCESSIQLLVLRHYRPEMTKSMTARYDAVIDEWMGRVDGGYKVDYRGPFNYSRMMNFALQHLRTDTEFVCFANDDILFGTQGWTNAMIALMRGKQAPAIVGSKLVYPREEGISLEQLCASPARHYGKVQHSGAIVVQEKGTIHLGRGLHHEDPRTLDNQSVEAVTFAHALVHRRLLDRVAFDEQLGYDYNDMDICLQALELGETIVYCARSVHFHLETVTRREFGEHNCANNQKYFLSKWKDRISRAPAPNDVTREYGCSSGI